MGTNNGALIHGAGFATGKVGQGFAFTGGDQYVQIPDAPALNPTNGLTLEAWVFVANYPGSDGIGVAGKDVPWGQRQYLLGLNPVGNRWSFRPYVGVPGGVAFFNGTLPVQTNTWYHAAMTYDGSQLRLYVNGVPDGSLPITGPLVRTSGPLFIGYYGPYSLRGGVDEVGLYSRALDASEIQAIYNAGSAGKCGVPRIRTHPHSQIGYWGKSLTFDLTAFGEPPLNYQWLKGGVPIADATATSLVLTNLQMTDAGVYTVVVSNTHGSVTSNPAMLTMNPAGSLFPCTRVSPLRAW